jgi:hypothetical protein
MFTLSTNITTSLLSQWTDPVAFERTFVEATGQGEIDVKHAPNSSSFRAFFTRVLDGWRPSWREDAAIASWIVGESIDAGARRLGVSVPTFYRRRNDEVVAIRDRINSRYSLPLLGATSPADREGLLFHEDVVSRIVDLLTGMNGAPCRAAVLGPFGSGKTTVALRLARDAALRLSFPDGIVAVEIPHDVDAQQGWCQAVFEFVDEQYKASGPLEAQLLNVRHILRNRKILFLIDDVRHADMWRCIELLGNGCACLVTTALPDVALSVGQSNVFELRPLTGGQVTHLLKSRISDSGLRAAGIAADEFWSSVQPLIGQMFPWYATLVAGRIRELIASAPRDQLLQEISTLLLGTAEPSGLQRTEPAEEVLSLLDLLDPELRRAMWVFRYLPAMPAIVSRAVVSDHLNLFGNGARAMRLLTDVDIVRETGEHGLMISPVMRVASTLTNQPSQEAMRCFVGMLDKRLQEERGMQTMAICVLPLAAESDSPHLVDLLGYIEREGTTEHSWVVDVDALSECIDRIPDTCLLSFCKVATPLLQGRSRWTAVSKLTSRLGGLQDLANDEERLAYGLLLETYVQSEVNVSLDIQQQRLAERSFENSSVRRSVVMAKITELLNRMQVQSMRRLMDRFTPADVERRSPRDGTFVAATAQLWLHYLCGEPVHGLVPRIESLADRAAANGYLGALNFGRAALGWIHHFAGNYSESVRYAGCVRMDQLLAATPLMSHLIQNVECLNDMAHGFRADARERARRAAIDAERQSQWLELTSLLLTLARVELDEGNSEAALDHARQALSTAKRIRNKAFLSCAAGLSTAAISRMGGNPELIVLEAKGVQDEIDPWSKLIWSAYSIERHLVSGEIKPHMLDEINQSMSLARTLGCPEFEARARFTLAQLHFCAGHADEARNYAFASLEQLQKIGHCFCRNVIAWMADKRMYRF